AHSGQLSAGPGVAPPNHGTPRHCRAGPNPKRQKQISASAGGRAGAARGGDFHPAKRRRAKGGGCGRPRAAAPAGPAEWGGEPLPLPALQMAEYTLREVRRLIAAPYGLFLVVGPTGSGKTTTLHAALEVINTPERKIWTAEDPVEITQRGLRQVQVHPRIGFTFAAALRALLRADPDVIMVGEMRDAETAHTGIEASLTGHLVFSTLHTNSAPETITRLLDMGLDSFNFADALLGVLAQRLARTLCKACKVPYAASAVQYQELRQGDGAAGLDAFGPPVTAAVP